MHHAHLVHRVIAGVGREFDGTLVRHETFVFLDVIWLTRILKPLLNHKDTELFDGKVFLGDTGDTGIILDDEGHIEAWNRLKQEGVLEPDLARVMWPDLMIMSTMWERWRVGRYGRSYRHQIESKK